LPRNFAFAQGRTWPAVRTAALDERTQRRNVWLLISLATLVVGVVVVGGFYSIYLAKNTPAEPPLPAAPAHAVLLSHLSKTDMLDGNFILDSALYRVNQPPTKVIAFYRSLLRNRANQIGTFTDPATSILGFNAPDALQHIPPVFHIEGASDANAAQYVYTEYSFDDHDVGIAVDTRFTHGPTLVYEEMLTQPSDAGF